MCICVCSPFDDLASVPTAHRDAPGHPTSPLPPDGRASAQPHPPRPVLHRESCENAHLFTTFCAPSSMRQYRRWLSCLSFWMLLWNLTHPIPKCCPTSVDLLFSPFKSLLTTSTQVPFFHWHTIANPQSLRAFLAGCLLSSLGFSTCPAACSVSTRFLWRVSQSLYLPLMVKVLRLHPALGHSSSRARPLLSSPHTDTSL